jgi:hypothetical protein
MSDEREGATDPIAARAAAAARCRRGVHSYVIPRSYVQISPTRYVQVCWACGQTDYCDGVAPEVAPQAGDAS